MCAATLKITRVGRARRQSGVIPYRFNADSLEVMLITSRSGNRLLVPKGCIEPELSAVASAQKEALEEAGIVGAPHRHPIGTVLGMRRGKRCFIDLWPMRVTLVHAVWPEMSFRTRLWVAPAEAADLVDRADLAELIMRLADRLMYGDGALAPAAAAA